MVYTCSELLNKLGSFSKINASIKRKEYFKVSYGLYSDKSPFLCELESIFIRFPNAVLTLQSAFAFYGMTDYVPEKYVVATSQGAHKIKSDKVQQIYITDELLDIGKIVVKTDDGVINIYDKERMLIELFRLKSKLSYSYFKEIVNSYRGLVKEEKIDFNKLTEHCSKFKNGQSIRKQIQDIIL